MGKQFVICSLFLVSSVLVASQLNDDGKLSSPGTLFVKFGLSNISTELVKENGEVHKLVDQKCLRCEARALKLSAKKNKLTYFVLKGLSKEEVAAVLEISEKYSQKKDWSCVLTNCKFLSAAGFSIPKLNLHEYFQFDSLYRDILANGLFFQEKKLEVVERITKSLEEIDTMHETGKSEFIGTSLEISEEPPMLTRP